VRNFLGLIGYYRRFVKDLLKIVSLLTNLLKKVIKFKWTDKCEETFQELKRWVTTALILTLPVEGKEYAIYSNASTSRLGCVLIQEDKVITYASQQLKPARRTTPFMIWN